MSNITELPAEKACTGCFVVKPLEAFNREKRNLATGHASRCKACARERYLANREKVLAQVARYQARNAELIREKRRARHTADPERKRLENAASYQKHRESRMARAAARRAEPAYAAEAAERTARWRAQNPERSRETIRRHREQNLEKIRIAVRVWHANNPMKVRAYRARRRGLLKASSTVPITAAQIESRLDFYGYRCWMCGGPFEHLDHVKPLSKGGMHCAANLRPACGPCNLGKKDKWFGPFELDRFRR